MIGHTEGLILDEGHVYRWNGRAVPGVTTIMEPLYTAAYYGMPQGRKEGALARGTAVHEVVAAYETAGRGHVRRGAEYSGQLRAWAAFRRDYGFTAAPTLVETRLFAPVLGYAGTPDIVIDDTVIDVKSSDTPCPITAVQTMAYAELLRTAGVKATKRIGVALRADGTYDARLYTDDVGDRNVFRSLLVVYRYVEKNLGGGVK